MALRNFIPRVATVMVVIAASVVAGCTPRLPTSPEEVRASGGGGGAAPASSANAVTITSAGVSPKTIWVARGARVTFVNNDSRQHEMNSQPSADQSDCPEINQVGFLSPGQSKQTGVLNTPRVCGYHDYTRQQDTSLHGTIVVQ